MKVFDRIFLEKNPVVGLNTVVSRDAVTPKRESVRINNPIAANKREVDKGLERIRSHSEREQSVSQ